MYKKTYVFYKAKSFDETIFFLFNIDNSHQFTERWNYCERQYG